VKKKKKRHYFSKVGGVRSHLLFHISKKSVYGIIARKKEDELVKAEGKTSIPRDWNATLNNGAARKRRDRSLRGE